MKFKAGDDCVLTTTVGSYSSGTRVVVVQTSDNFINAEVRSKPGTVLVLTEEDIRLAKRVQGGEGDYFEGRSKYVDSK